MVGTVDPANLGRVSTLYYHLVGANYGELFEAWAVAEGYLAERAARNEDRALVRATLEPYLADEDDDASAAISRSSSPTTRSSTPTSASWPGTG